MTHSSRTGHYVSTATNGRRSRWAAFVAVLVALVAVGGTYALLSASSKASAAPTESATSAQIEEGKNLFLEGCSSCHGLKAEGIDGDTIEAGGNGGPSLIGVGAAAVHFQVSTGRMPLAGPEAQAPQKAPSYNEEETAALAAYIASLAPGPEIPTAEDLKYEGASIAEGGELFRTNCTQCHNFAGRGGALSDGAYAPSLMEASPQVIWEAMATGPQQMPVFSDQTLTPENKKSIIKYVTSLQTASNPGGLDLGSLGPVTEGLFVWIAGLGLIIVVAVWIGAKVR